MEKPTIGDVLNAIIRQFNKTLKRDPSCISLNLKVVKELEGGGLGFYRNPSTNEITYQGIPIEIKIELEENKILIN